MTDDGRKHRLSEDVMHGRSFAGESVASNEDEQTRDRERAAHDPADEAGEPIVTDAELEARRKNRG